MGINDNSEIIFHNRSSTDFGIKVLFPFNPLAPAPKKQLMSIPGRSGDWATNDSTYNSSETPVNVVIHLPRRYDDWEQLKNDIENWLYGDEDWLRFSKNSDYLYRAQIVTAPTFTPVNFERTNATFTFHFQPYKYDADSIHWKDFPRNGVVYNRENIDVKPDWHINGKGNFMLKVNDVPYEFNNIDGDIYLKGDEGNAYTNDPTAAYLIDGLLNDHVRLANNAAPVLYAEGDGSNSISIEPMDTNSILNKAEFIPRWRRLI